MQSLCKKFGCAAALSCLITTAAWAQGIFGTLTGVVTDPSGAVVAKSNVKLTDAGSGSERATVTDGQGYYTFASIPVGTYNLTVETAGFQTYKVDGIGIGGGEKRNVNVTLQVGEPPRLSQVTGSAEILAPVDSGEKSVDADNQGTAELTSRSAATPPSTSRSCRDSASRTARRIRRTTAAK